MTIVNPADAVEARAAVEAAILHNGPMYLRFGRMAVPVIYDKETYKFELGKGVKMTDGTDVTIVATGIMVDMALTAAELLKAEGISARVVNIHTIKPLDKELIIKCAQETGAIVSAEEHSVIGGLGGAVAEALCEAGAQVPMAFVGTQDLHGECGPYNDLLAKYGMDAAAVAKKVREVVAKK
jgi:transketolase